MTGCSCGCDSVNLIYACSGAANTGFLSDSVARKLMNNGAGKMTCLIAIGADVSGFIESAKCAKKNIVIDGCSVSCGKKIFEKLNIEFNHFKTTDFNVQKGKTIITQEVIEKVTSGIAERI